jgi:2'-5' RNA ligase
MSLRLFLALIPDALEAEATLRLQRAIAWPAGAKLVRRENLHVTLHFLGGSTRPAWSRSPARSR